MHGSNLSGIVTILRRGGDKVKENINKSYSYVSWIYDGDKSNNLKDICPKNSDLGWAVPCRYVPVRMKLQMRYI